MTQEAVITASFPNNKAEAVVIRGTACGSNCGNCESCIYQNELHTIAENNIGASVGQRVVIESKSSLVFKAAFLVYILPLIFLVSGYLIAEKNGLNEGLCILYSFAALLVGVFIVVISQKNKKPIPYEIISIDSKVDNK